MTIPFDALCGFRSPDVYNPWAQDDALDLEVAAAGPAARLARLKAHFAVDAELILVGEAAKCGWRDSKRILRSTPN